MQSITGLYEHPYMKSSTMRGILALSLIRWWFPNQCSRIQSGLFAPSLRVFSDITTVVSTMTVTGAKKEMLTVDA